MVQISNASWVTKIVREKDPLIMTATGMLPNMNRVVLNGNVRACSNSFGNGIITDATSFGFLSEQTYHWILFQAFPNYCASDGTFVLSTEIRSSAAALLDNRWAVVSLMKDSSANNNLEVATTIGRTIAKLMVV